MFYTFLLVSLIRYLSSLEYPYEPTATSIRLTQVAHKLVKQSIMASSGSQRKSGNYPNIRRGKNHALLYISLVLILNSSDTEMNPGPRTPKYPCQICSKAVTWKQRGVACDDCLQWYHADCMHMSTPVYMSLNNISWHCTNCGMPNFSTSLFDSINMSTSNTFTSLNNSDICSQHSPGPPMSCSSPSNPKQASSVPSNMKVIIINFRSFKNKREEVNNIIDQSDPSVIIGTETWLNPSINSCEYFPPNYEVIRKDRKDGYGGVLLAVKKDFVIDQMEITTVVEAVFVKLQLGKNLPLIIGSLYRPPSSGPDYMNDLCQTLEDLYRENKNATLWIGGDLNLPDIRWQTASVEGNQVASYINTRFLDMIQNCCLEQAVNFPTRNDNTLDLFLTNRPSLINRCIAIPGVSDHDGVYIESSVSAKRGKPVRRKIYIWKRADLDHLKTACLNFQHRFMETYSITSSVENMWHDISSTLTTLLDSSVPSKMSSSRFSQPWINRDIKALSRRKKKSFKKARSTKKPKDVQRYQHLKKVTRSACKKAYHKYINDIISPDSTSNPKRFWGFINSKKKDSSGVAPLKSSDGLTYSDPASKANILNDQFSSVFNSDEPSDNIKDMGNSDIPNMPDIHVTANGVEVAQETSDTQGHWTGWHLNQTAEGAGVRTHSSLHRLLQCLHITGHHTSRMETGRCSPHLQERSQEPPWELPTSIIDSNYM